MDLSPNEIIAIASDHAGFGLKQVLDQKIRSYGLGVLKKIKYSEKTEYVLRPDFINYFKMLIN